jgi:hypothetical protein
MFPSGNRPEIFAAGIFRSGKLDGKAFRDWIAAAPVINQGRRPVARDTHSSKLFVMTCDAAEWISATPSELIFLFEKVPGAFRIHLHPSLESDWVAGFGPAAEHG